MSAYEIVLGVVLIIASVLIIVFTLAQTQKGQGLSAAIVGDNSFMAAGRARGRDARRARVPKRGGGVLCGARSASSAPACDPRLNRERPAPTVRVVFCGKNRAR